jgi:hypothetical protein
MESGNFTELLNFIEKVEASRLYNMVKKAIDIIGPAGTIIGIVTKVLIFFAERKEDGWIELEKTMNLKVKMIHGLMVI